MTKNTGSTCNTNEAGDKLWLNVEGKPHREGGPAIENVDGHKAWYRNGKPHRVGGPAVEFADRSKAWYLYGVLLFETKRKIRTERT